MQINRYPTIRFVSIPDSIPILQSHSIGTRSAAADASLAVASASAASFLRVKTGSIGEAPGEDVDELPDGSDGEEADVPHGVEDLGAK